MRQEMRERKTAPSATRVRIESIERERVERD